MRVAEDGEIFRHPTPHEFPVFGSEIVGSEWTSVGGTSPWTVPLKWYRGPFFETTQNLVSGIQSFPTSLDEKERKEKVTLRG